MIVIIVVVTGGKQSLLLAFALGLGWSLTKRFGKFGVLGLVWFVRFGLVGCGC